MKTQKHKNTKTQKHKFLNELVFRYLIFSLVTFWMWGCQMEILEESLPETETTVQAEGLFQVQSVNKTLLNSLGKKMSKQTGFNVIESAQQRALSDFIFDLDASLLTTDTLNRRTYTVPFLEKGDNYSTFNLVMVADSVDNVLDQYVLEYSFDSIQYQTYQQTNDLLSAGVTINRFPFSSFFNDSSPGFLERCDGVYDANGDPITCDQVTIDYGSGGGGGEGSGGTAWITPGGSTSGDGGSTGSGSGSSGSGSPSSGGGYGGTSCSWTFTTEVVGHNYGGSYCEPDQEITVLVLTITCGSDPYSRKNNAPEGLMTCMDCSVSDFGSPAFTKTRNAVYIDNILSDFALTDWHMAYLSDIKNNVFADEYRAFLQAQANLDQKAAFITLTAQMEGVLTGQMTQNFARSIDNLVAADLSNPAIFHLFSTYFSARAAFLKLSNPQKYYKNPSGNLNDPNNINGLVLFYDTFSEALHWTLDVIGLVPFLGEPADLLSAGFYVLEGDGVNATISLASTIPILGTATSGTKMVMKIVASDIQTKQTIRWIVGADGTITFGTNKLRKMFPEILTSEHAHHIIPKEEIIQRHPVVQRAARSQNAFHLHDRLNGLPVEASRNTNHPDYTNLIYNKLQQINSSRNQNKSNEWFYDQLMIFIEEAKAAINATKEPINKITF